LLSEMQANILFISPLVQSFDDPRLAVWPLWSVVA
jgi:hypothetical protein